MVMICALCQSYSVFIHFVSVQVHVKQEQNSKKLLGKLSRKASALPDIEDCSKCSSSISLFHDMCHDIKLI